MCLIIDFHQHNKFFGKFRPRIAFRNILVHKYLICIIDEHVVYTPYQKTKCLFKDGICELREYQMIQSVKAYRNSIRTIEKGIHSTVRRDSAYIYTYFYAIIPRFSLYWVGRYGDIVSNRLIIFTNSKWSNWKTNHKAKEFEYE